MVLISKIHGKLEYEEDEIITFKNGIPGFDDLRKFIVVELKEYEPFKLLQSLENHEVGIILTSPFDIYDNYEIKLSDETIKSLEIKQPEEVLVLTTITLGSNQITTNLKAPIVVNISNRLGEQIIVDNLDYSIKYPLLKE